IAVVRVSGHWTEAEWGRIEASDGPFAGFSELCAQLAIDLGYIPVVPPLSTRIEPWDYDRQLYKRRNEVERSFRWLKGFRRVFSRFDKLDVMFTAFILFASIVEALR
ncbi:hypothetical protein OY671_012138, partial [Metschnikowia pulcherrima]